MGLMEQLIILENEALTSKTKLLMNIEIMRTIGYLKKKKVQYLNARISLKPEKKMVSEQRKICLNHQETEDSSSFTSTNRITQAPPDTIAATTQATQDTTADTTPDDITITITTKIELMFHAICPSLKQWKIKGPPQP